MNYMHYNIDAAAPDVAAEGVHTGWPVMHVIGASQDSL